MSIIYALIAREEEDLEYGRNFHVLVEHSGDSTGNFPQVTRELVLKEVPKNQKSVYNYKGKYAFHCLSEEGFTYLCLADVDYPKSRAQVFLEEMRIAFCNKYSTDQRNSAISYGLSGFTDVIKQKMEYYNSNKVDPRLAKIRHDAGATLHLMEQNLETIIDRGEKIELLVKKAHTLNVESGNLKARALTFKEQARNEALKKTILLGGIVLVVVYFVFIR